MKNQIKALKSSVVSHVHIGAGIREILLTPAGIFNIPAFIINHTINGPTTELIHIGIISNGLKAIGVP